MRKFYTFFLAACVAFAQTYSISTFAGGGLPTNIAGPSTSLFGPQSVALDAAGNLYFADYADVLRMDAKTGLVSVVAGTGMPGFSGDNGPATNAQLNFIPGLNSGAGGVAIDGAGNVYIADSSNQRIRKVTNGVITTVAGAGTPGFNGDNGPAATAQLYNPIGVAVDAAGNLYIADTSNSRIRKVSNGTITTVAGGGASTTYGVPATSAQLYDPEGVAFDSAGNMYIADYLDSRVYKVSNGIITVAAGNGQAGFAGDNGPATSAELNAPDAVAVDSLGNIYISDYGNTRIRMVSGGVITTLAGNGIPDYSGDGGAAANALISRPQGVAVDAAGDLYFADTRNARVRKISDGTIATAVGGGPPLGDNGPATSAGLNISGRSQVDLAVDAGGALYITDSGNNVIRKVSNGVMTTVAGGGTSLAENVPATSAQLAAPEGVAVDAAGNIYVSDTSQNRVRKVAGGTIVTIAGTGMAGFSGDGGLATSATLTYPAALAVDSAGDLFIQDDLRIRKLSNGIITTVAGTGSASTANGCPEGLAASTQVWGEGGIATDTSGDLFIPGDACVQELTNGTIATVAGPGGVIDGVWGVAVDAAGNLYIADTDTTYTPRILKVADGSLSTIGGGGTGGFTAGGPAADTYLPSARAVAVDQEGNVYFADTINNRIGVLTPGTTPTINKNGIVPIYSSTPVVQPGSWVSIYGTNLANGTSVWSGNFPTLLGGVSVTIDGKPASLWVVSPTQINLQVPDDATTGPVNVVVNAPTGTVTSTVTLAPQSPSLSLLTDGKHVAATIATPNGNGAYGGGTYDLLGPSNTFSFSARPVHPGETLTLYGVGFGATKPAVSAGQVFNGPAAPTANPVTVTIGGAIANVTFAGIVEAGLYQINVVVPSVPSGDQAVLASVNGVASPTGPVVSVQ